MRTYTTVQGDMWDSIAFSQLGDCERTDALMNANQEYRNVFVFPSGVVLTIPDIPQKKHDSLPPWKKVSG